MSNKLQINKNTLIMGILNVTPDSFSDGGLYNNVAQALERTKQMIKEGADIIDIGGESTRPGSESVSIPEELKRVIPVIQAIRKDLGENVLLSTDTYKAHVAEEALKAGANIINSLGGFTADTELATIVAKFQCPIIIYHSKGEPKTMQKGEIQYTDVIDAIAAFFAEQIATGLKSGVKREQFILDPGIGFGKTVEQNIEIVKRLKEFAGMKLPLLIGVSRKSHLGMLLQKELKFKDIPSPTERLEASLAETAIAVINGANIVRTHDIEQTKKFLAVLDKFKNSEE